MPHGIDYWTTFCPHESGTDSHVAGDSTKPNFPTLLSKDLLNEMPDWLAEVLKPDGRVDFDGLEP